MVDQGSLKSATHGNPVARFKASPMRCMLCGGPVVTMRSTGSRRNRASVFLVAGFTQPTRASGTNTLPRTHLTTLEANEGEGDWLAPSRDVLPWSPNLESARVGSQTGKDHTSTPSWTSLTSEGSVTGTSGLEGVTTTGSQPNSGSSLANLSQRCTPPPPEGGQ